MGEREGYINHSDGPFLHIILSFSLLSVYDSLQASDTSSRLSFLDHKA